MLLGVLAKAAPDKAKTKASKGADLRVMTPF
jgi:hypothetical protein